MVEGQRGRAETGAGYPKLSLRSHCDGVWEGGNAWICYTNGPFFFCITRLQRPETREQRPLPKPANANWQRRHGSGYVPCAGQGEELPRERKRADRDEAIRCRRWAKARTPLLAARRVGPRGSPKPYFLFPSIPSHQYLNRRPPLSARLSLPCIIFSRGRGRETAGWSRHHCPLGSPLRGREGQPFRLPCGK